MTILTLRSHNATTNCGDQVAGTRHEGGAGSSDLHEGYPQYSTLITVTG